MYGRNGKVTLEYRCKSTREKVSKLAWGKKNKAVVYEGQAAEQYKHMKNKWIRLAVVGTGLPFVISCLVALFSNTFNFLDLFSNGEIILSLFSLNLPLAFDLFEIKKKNDEYLSWAFWGCIIVVCFQLVLYCLVKMTSGKSGVTASVIVSVIMISASWICCACSIKAMFQHSTMDKGGDDNVD